MALKVGELYASFGIDTSGIDNAISGIEQKCANIASSLAKTGAAMSLAITTPLVKFGKDVFEVGTEFEAQMSRVQGISDATAEELVLLTQNAKDLGAASVYSATEAAQGMEYLASAGFDASQIMAAMPGMLDLAASSGEDLAMSAEIAASTLRGFGMEANEAGRVANVLAKNAATTNAAVYDTGEAMKYIAPLANTMGLRFEEVTAAIGIMSDAGIKGGQAGTSLRGAFSRMAKPTEVMATKMEQLGISFYTGEGKMKSIQEIVEMLQISFQGLTEEQQQNALVTLFGQEALSGWMALLNAGPEELEELTTALKNSDGAAQKMAETMLDNLKGSIEGFNGSLETAKLNLYDSFAPAMQTAVEAATAGMDAFNLLDEASKQVVYKVGALAAAAGPAMAALGGFVAAVGHVIPFMVALASPMGVVASGLALFAVAAVDANNDIGKAFSKMSKEAAKALKKLNSRILSAMSTVSKRMPYLCATVSDGIQAIVPELVTTAMLAITGFADTIADNAQYIANVGASIIESVLDGITRNLPALIQSGAEMIGSIGAALIRNIPSLVESVGEIVAAIGDGLLSTDWLAIGKEIVTAIGDAVYDLVSLFGYWFESAKEAAQNVTWGDIWETIKGAFNVASDWLKNLILGDAATDSATWADVGSKIWGWIKSGFTATGDWIKSLVLGESYTVDASWADVGASIWSKIKEGFKETSDWIKSLVLGEDAASDSSWADVGEKIVEKISGALSSIDFSSESLSANVSKIADFMNGLVEKMLTAKADHAVAITQFVTDLISSISSFGGWATLASYFNTIASSIIDGIVAAIPQIANAGVNIVNAIGSLMSGIDWTTLGSTAEMIGTTLIDGIVAGLSATASGATSIVNALTSMIYKIEWAELGESAANLATTLIDGIMTGSASLVPDMTELYSAIGRGIAAAGEGLGTVAGELINKLVVGMLTPENWAKLLNVGLTIVNGIALGISELGEGIIRGAWGVVEGTLTGLLEALGFETIEWSQETEAALAESVTVIDQSGEAVVTSLTNVMDTLENINLSDGLSASDLEIAMSAWSTVIANGTGELVASLDEYAWLGCEQITALFQILTDETASAANRAAAMIALNDLGYSDLVSNSFKDCDTGIREAARKMSENGVTTFEQAFSVLGMTIPEAVQAGLDAGMPLVEAAAAATAAAASTANDKVTAEASASATGTAVTTSLADAETAGQPGVETATDGVVDVATLALETLPDAAQITGTDTTNALATGIANNTNAPQSAAQSTASAVNEATKSVLSYSAGSSIGYQFDAGIAAGIRQGASTISSAARSAARSALSAAKTTLGIHSPSSVAEKEVGWMYDAGIAEGVLGKIGLIQSAAKKVTSAMHDSFLVGDPSRGTVYTSGDTIRQTARQTAEASNERQSVIERAEAIGRSIADRLIESGALGSDVYMDGDKVGEKVYAPVSKNIARKTRQTVKGRTAAGVMA